jgi:predicted HNH restriction endonuclease
MERGLPPLGGTEIDRNDVPPRLKSRTIDVLVGRIWYPAKHLVRLAAKHATGTEPSRFHAHQAEACLKALGYDTLHRRKGQKARIVVEDDESAFPEGRVRYRLHRELERDSAISKAAKKKRLQSAGKLECDVCGFDFACSYGELGEGFIEAHHTVPISSLSGKTKTKIKDLTMVCSNCHRMLHRGRLLSVKELRKLFRTRANE